MVLDFLLGVLYPVLLIFLVCAVEVLQYQLEAIFDLLSGGEADADDDQDYAEEVWENEMGFLKMKWFKIHLSILLGIIFTLIRKLFSRS